MYYKLNWNYFELSSTISDIDECSEMNPCVASTNCVNTPGSYKCVCYASLSEPNCAAGMDMNVPQLF